VTVYDLEDRRLRVVDSGPLAPAVRASCSMPGMFMPAEVDGRASWDGGIVEKVPLAPLASRADVDTILVSFLRHVPPRGLPGSVMAGLREVIHSLVHPSDQRTADEIRSRGKEVLVIAPDVPACGPFRLASGREIVEAAREDTLRILEAERFGCPELG
jgi:predicted acylesterase/phospholipase RssA